MRVYTYSDSWFPFHLSASAVVVYTATVMKTEYVAIQHSIHPSLHSLCEMWDIPIPNSAVLVEYEDSAWIAYARHDTVIGESVLLLNCRLYLAEY